MALPADHELRRELNDEVHARPPVPLQAPRRISYVVLLSDAAQYEAQWRLVTELCRSFDRDAPGVKSSHLLIDLGPLELKFERHTEFSRLKFIAPGARDDPFADPAIRSVPADWLSRLPGTVLVATHVALVPAATLTEDIEEVSTRLFAGHPLVGSAVSGASAVAVTDFRIHGDGFGRVLIRDRGMTPRQAGRIVTRMLEIDTYRMMALLAFPIARRLGPELTERERELADISRLLAAGRGGQSEQSHLDRLLQLEAAIESRYADTQYRFSASAAYYDLVQRRIAELREERVPGMQTLQEFMERRLAPAMATCRSSVSRIEALSTRVARATQLLSTRVDVTREAQNQSLLETMARRAKMQLRLQQTVEGLSVVAISYYVVGLVGYLAKGLRAAGAPLSPDVLTALSIPIVFGLVAYGVKRMRRLLGLERA